MTKPDSLDKTPLERAIRIKELERLIRNLEYGDDYLFTNRNGNLPMYEAWQRELRELRDLQGKE